MQSDSWPLQQRRLCCTLLHAQDDATVWLLAACHPAQQPLQGCIHRCITPGCCVNGDAHLKNAVVLMQRLCLLAHLWAGRLFSLKLSSSESSPSPYPRSPAAGGGLPTSSAMHHHDEARSQVRSMSKFQACKSSDTLSYLTSCRHVEFSICCFRSEAPIGMQINSLGLIEGSKTLLGTT